MTISINSSVAGQFKIYTETVDGNLKLISESPNMIVDTGLHSISGQTWVEAFTRVLAGSGSTAVQASDTFSGWQGTGELILSATTPSVNPASYTIAEYLTGNPALGPLSAGAFYRFGKAWKLTNTLSTSATIRQLGTCNDTNVLFSKATITPFSFNPSQFVYVVYELRLYTYTSTLTSNLAVTVPSGDPATYNFGSNRFGIVNIPVAYYTINGTTGALTTQKAFSSGYGLYEPSQDNLYLYKQLSAYDALSAKRSSFESNPLVARNNSGSAAPTNAYGLYGLGESKFEIELPRYSGDFKIKRNIVIAPTGSTEVLRGFVITNQTPSGSGPYTVPTSLEQGGLHCIFDAPWTRPRDSFLKIYFEHNWNRLP